MLCSCEEHGDDWVRVPTLSELVPREPWHNVILGLLRAIGVSGRRFGGLALWLA